MHFRIDRFLTLYFFHPLCKRRASFENRIPVLMYHGISGKRKLDVHPYFETVTTPAIFARQMSFLKDNGYQVSSLDNLWDIFSMPGNRGEKWVVITFDDGLLDFYTEASPILERFNFPTTVFLPVGLMGQEVANQSVMSWGNARELADKGIAFGSHSMSHPKLSELDWTAVEYEIRVSKEKIEDELGREVTSFSYPYAFPEQNKLFVCTLGKCLSGCGYITGVTTLIGRCSATDARLFLKRLPVNYHDDIPLFKAKLEGGYDWLHAGQNVFKKAKNLRRFH